MMYNLIYMANELQHALAIKLLGFGSVLKILSECLAHLMTPASNGHAQMR